MSEHDTNAVCENCIEVSLGVGDKLSLAVDGNAHNHEILSITDTGIVRVKSLKGEEEIGRATYADMLDRATVMAISFSEEA